MFPWYLAALADKTLLLASEGEWEQALDTAQRLLDADGEHLDALRAIAVHAFTQESQPHDALQKLEDLDNAVSQREPSSVDFVVEVATLFSRVCARQPRALQICARLLERACKHADSDERLAVVLCQLGHVHILQGMMQYERAMKAFREATKRDPNNAQALQGMILCQLCEGAAEDAESQVELLTLMHSPEELGFEFAYLQSLMLRDKKGDAKREHLASLLRCREQYLRQMQHGGEGEAGNAGTAAGGDADMDQLMGAANSAGGVKAYLDAFGSLSKCNPDFAMLLAIDFFTHMEATSTISSYVPSTSSLLNAGGFKDALMQQGGADPGAAGGVGGAGSLTMAAGVGGLLDGDGMGSPGKAGPSSSGAQGGTANASAAGLEISEPVKMGLDLLQQVKLPFHSHYLPILHCCLFKA